MQKTKETSTDCRTALNHVVVGIGHELNNPNAFIRLNASNLKKLIWLLGPCLDEFENRHPGALLGPFCLSEIRSKINGCLDSILEATVRIIMVADQLKQLWSSSLEMDVKVSMFEVVRGELERHRFFLEKTTRVQIVKTCESGFPVKGHKLQLGQAVAILLINGADAIHERFGEKCREKGFLKVALQEKDGNILVQISDNGEGMSEEVLKQVTTPYFTTKPQGQGEGLGLSLCESILKRHGGDLQIRSEKGAGTEATIILPRWEA